MRGDVGYENGDGIPSEVADEQTSRKAINELIRQAGVNAPDVAGQGPGQRAPHEGWDQSNRREGQAPGVASQGPGLRAPHQGWDLQGKDEV